MKELEPTSGTIIVNDQNLGKMKRRKVPKYRRGVGVVFQDFRLLKDRNVYENVAFAQRVIERPNRVIKKRVPELLTLVGLAEKYKSCLLYTSGMGLGAAFKFIVDGLKIVPSDIATPNIKGYAGQIGVEIYPALIGVGYICGPSISSYMFAGGIIAWLVLIPAVVFFGGSIDFARCV